MLFSSRIKELETQLASVSTQRDQLTTENANLTAQLAEHATELPGLQTQISAHEVTITQLNADLDTARTAATTAQAALKAEQEGREAAIKLEVTNRLGAAGIAPIARDPNATKTPAESKTAGLTGLARTRAYLADRQPKAAVAPTTPTPAPAPAAA